jgi:ribose 5-phosphate isomerase A
MTLLQSCEQDGQKRAAAARAIEEVEDGMVLGLGSGSTAAFAVEALAARIAKGLRVAAIPSSEATAALARQFGVPLTSLAKHRRIDVTIDGADQVERGTLNLIKGLGGALLREKIVAAASDRFVVVVDDEKLVDRLGEHAPVPVEVARFGWQATAAALERLGAEPELRRGDSGPFVTDGGNLILDCHFGPIASPKDIECAINLTVGVVENGLFVGRSSAVVVGSDSGIDLMTRHGWQPR